MSYQTSVFGFNPEVASCTCSYYSGQRVTSIHHNQSCLAHNAPDYHPPEQALLW